MTDSGDGHVRFRKPPAVETLQGVFFRPLTSFTSAHQGLLWTKYFRRDFPVLQEKNCLEQVDERFDESALSTTAVRWKVSNRPETPRLWAQSEKGDHVVQIQRDALLTNWLKQDSEGQYRHYESRRADFEDKLRKVSQFFEEEGIGELEPTSCLMTYVNHVPVDSLSMVPELTADIFTFWSEDKTEEWLPHPDRLVINISYPMREQKGRLHVSVVPVIHSRHDGEQFVLRFDLTARGRPERNTLEGALQWLDIGHKWIVKGFVDITRKNWHDKWERVS
jgi:uncharacterized protein (TIGR04255 family)